MTDWSALVAQDRYRDVAMALIDECAEFSLIDLSTDPWGTVSGSITVSVQDQLVSGCGGGGYYRPEPPTIYLHPATARRNNFTLLHELGHHLQQHHPELGFVLLDLSQHGRKLAEERISDEIASHLLMPLDDGGPHEVVRHPAEVMAGLFASTSASRSAVLRKVVSLLPGNAKWILAVADLAGVVEYAQSTYSDAQPARGSTQPGLAALATEAVDGPVRRRFHEGLRYSKGSELHSMMAEAALDTDGRYVFVALTPEARFGTGDIVWPTFECANAACGRSFERKWVKRYCDKCGDPACSWCDRCSCDPTNTGVLCDRCFMPWAPAEVDAGHHEC